MIKKSKSIREQVYEKLKELIAEGKINQGERIVEVEYAEKFQVSRTPLREAIRMLELDGFLEVNLKGGVIVKTITEEDIEEVFQIRIALEAIILKEIIKSGKKNVELLENILEETRIVIDKKESFEEVVRLFSKFNETFYSISKFEKVISMLRNINLYLKISSRYSVKDYSRRKKSFNEHCELINALKDKNLEAALSINEKHLETSKKFFIENLKK